MAGRDESSCVSSTHLPRACGAIFPTSCSSPRAALWPTMGLARPFSLTSSPWDTTYRPTTTQRISHSRYLPKPFPEVPLKTSHQLSAIMDASLGVSTYVQRHVFIFLS